MRLEELARGMGRVYGDGSVEITDAAEADMKAIVPNASFLVNAVELYESSRRSDGKMVYTRLHRATL